jgi:hypothetical protein
MFCTLGHEYDLAGGIRARPSSGKINKRESTRVQEFRRIVVIA